MTLLHASSNRLRTTTYSLFVLLISTCLEYLPDMEASGYLDTLQILIFVDVIATHLAPTSG